MMSLSLQVDVELAKQQADKPDEDDNDLRKKLWLRIGKTINCQSHTERHSIQ